MKRSSMPASDRRSFARAWGASLAVAVLAASAMSVNAQSSIKVGVMTVLSGPLAQGGNEVKLGVDLAVKKLGGKIGGLPAEIFVEDGKMSVDTAQQSISRFLEQDKVDVIVGNVFSNQLLAYVPRTSAANVFVMTAVAGPSDLAGKLCDPNVFVYSWENNTPSEAVGQQMTQAGSKKAFFIAQNYVTGKEHVAGAKFFYKGEPVGDAFVPFAQVDFGSELASIRASGADSVYVFLPGAAGIAFIKQFEASGLKGKVQLYGGSWLADEHSFSALGPAALGTNIAANWFASLDNPTNKAFVEAFRKENGRAPVFYAAFAYDSVIALDAAVKAAGGIANKEAVRKELEKGKFDSVRGSFKFNVNHFPIQNFYAGKVVTKDGVTMHEAGKTIFTDHKDRFYQECKMKS